jgi:hypothetical protein
MSEVHYADINNDRVYPPLSRIEAGEAARELIRVFGDPEDAAYRSGYSFAMGGPYAWRAKRSELRRILRWWTDGHKSGARRVWVSRVPTSGHDKGWGRLIHDVSHMIHKYRHPNQKPHGNLHPQIEREVQIYVELHFLKAMPVTESKAAA